jgi:hypothetical protein
MGSLPVDRAGIGSAVNDTTRELGGALGVAIVGSIVSSLLPGGAHDARPDQIPVPDFLDAMSWGSIFVAAVTAVGALIAWRYLPDRAYGPAHALARHDA